MQCFACAAHGNLAHFGDVYDRDHVRVAAKVAPPSLTFKTDTIDFNLADDIWAEQALQADADESIVDMQPAPTLPTATVLSTTSSATMVCTGPKGTNVMPPKFRTLLGCDANYSTGVILESTGGTRCCLTVQHMTLFDHAASFTL